VGDNSNEQVGESAEGLHSAVVGGKSDGNKTMRALSRGSICSTRQFPMINVAVGAKLGNKRRCDF